MSIEIIRFCF